MMENSPDRVLDPDSFVAELKEYLMIGYGDFSLDSNLVDDVGLDSFQAVLALEFMTDAIGEAATLTEDECKAVYAAMTLRDLYGLYLTKSGMPEDDSGSRYVHPGQFRGRLVSLRPTRAADIPLLYEITNSDEISWRWRYGGTLPRYEEFVRSFDQGVLTQLVITECGVDTEPVGLVVAFGANLQHGIASIGAMVSRDRDKRAGRGGEAVIIFLRHLFNTWNLYKVYMEMPEFNIAQFGSALGRVCHLEGRLRDHYYYCGRRWDQLVVSIYREEFVNQWDRGASATLEAMRWRGHDGDLRCYESQGARTMVVANGKNEEIFPSARIG